MRKTKVTLSLSPLALLTLAACGGGGTTSITPAGSSTTTTTGNVQNGPLANAWAFLDLDNDGVWDDGTAADGGAVETRIRTEGTLGANSAGYYTLTTTATDYTLVAYTDAATIDTTTDTPYGANVTLKAPKGSTKITPNTTLVESVMAANTGLTATEAATKVAVAMGLPVGINVLTYDAYADQASMTDDEKEDALAVQQANNKIMTVVNTFAAVADGSGMSATASLDLAMGSMADVVKAKVTTGTTLSFTTDMDAIVTAVKDDLKIYSEANTSLNISVSDFDTVIAEAKKAVDNVVVKIDAFDITTSAADKAAVISTISTVVEEVKAVAVSVDTGATDAENIVIDSANPPESDMSSSLTPLEQLTYNLANSQGPQTQFTPEANTPNEKDVLGLDPANYFDNSNNVHFYGYTDMTVQPARDYHGEYTPERVVSYGPNENIFLIDPDNADQYFFAAETAGYASTLDGKRVPKLFKYDGLSFQDLVPLQLPELSRMQVGADNFFFEQEDDYLGLVSTNTDSGSGLGGDLLLLEISNGQVIERTADLPISLSADIYGRDNAANVHGMGVGDLTGNGRSDIVLGDFDVGIYAMLQADDGSWSIYQPSVFAQFMYEVDRSSLPTNYEYRPGQIKLFDVNNDGYDDIFVAFSRPGSQTNPAPSKPDLIYMNNGDGSFSIDYKIELSSPEGIELDNYQTVDSKVIDLNRDGFEDIMVFGTRVEPHYSGVFMQIHMNTGEGLFVDETTERLIAIKDRSISDKFNDYSFNFQYFDLNGDGHIDLLNYDNNYLESDPNDDLGKLQVFLNDGEGYFTEVMVEEHWATANTLQPYSTSQPFQIMAAGDFDKDGRIDFVTWHKSLTGSLDAEAVWYVQSSFKDPIYTGPNQIDVSSIAPGFNELYYLRNNPDVESLVDQGVYQTGLHHYLDLGLSEERAIFAPHSIVKSGDEGWDLVLTSGNEVGIGGAGDDILYGYDGDDTLTGGAGSDVFRFEAGDNGSDIITDFTLADGDKVDLTSFGITTPSDAQQYLSAKDGNVELLIGGDIIFTMNSASLSDLNPVVDWVV